LKPSKQFIEFLEQKLKVGNIRSIHLNAVPGKSNKRLDISLLKHVNSDLGEQFLTELLSNKNFDFRISSKGINLSRAKEEVLALIDLVFKRLENIYLENESDFLEHGVKTFGFGYPLLVKRSREDQTKVIVAPLVIWRLDIKIDARNNNSYTISRSDEDDIVFNPQLRAYLKNDEKLDVTGIKEEQLEDGILSRDELIDIINYSLSELKSTKIDSLGKFTVCEDRNTLSKRTAEQCWIKWSGVFGLYRSQKESIIKDIEELITGYDRFSFLPPENCFVDEFIASANNVDPSQEELLNNLLKNKKVIIQGPPGTGKSQSLTAIISHALAYGRKILVVCEKKTAIEVLFNNLSKLGLGHLCATVDDINKDRKKIVTHIRTLIDDPHSIPGDINLSKHQMLHNRFVAVRGKIVEKLNNTRKPFFSDYTWKEAVSEYLHNNGSESRLVMKNFLNHQLKLTFEEFEYLCSLLSDSQNLFKQIAEIKQDYESLNEELFLENLSQKRAIELRNLIEGNTRELQLILEKIAEIKQKYETSLIEKSVQAGLIYRLVSVFNKKFASAKKEAKDIVLSYSNFVKDSSRILDRDLGLPVDKFFYKSVEENLRPISSLYSEILNNYSTFNDYYNWKSHSMSVETDHYRQLLNELSKCKDGDWLKIFKGWYFHNLLLENELSVGEVIKDDRELLKLKDADEELRSSQVGAICHKWRETSLNSINQKQKKELKQLYNLAKNKKYPVRNSLRKLIGNDFEFFTNIFPVLFVNPSTASSILPLEENLFDYVIFDEASQLKIEDTFPSLLRGKYKVVSGDIHQMPPSDSFATKGVLNTLESIDDEEIENDIDAADKESLLKFADDEGYKFSYLNFHYRSRHPYLIDFSNAAFYESRLVPMPAREAYKPISFISLNGLYEDNTNPAEARKVVEILLNEIKPNIDGIYPSVGVATFNIQQRNLIFELIFQASEKSEIAYNKISALNKSGLFVKNLENIQGDERDIIIISTTFGYNINGKFVQNFGPINQEKGYKLLNVIVTRAKCNLYLLTSIPSIYYSKYEQELTTSGNKGKAVFYAYLAYAESCSLRNDSARQNILSLLEQNNDTKKGLERSDFVSTGNTESVFEEEVLDYLNEHLPEVDIQLQCRLGGFRIDMMVMDKFQQPILAIECDGKSYHSSAEAYRYDLHRQNIIEGLGIKVYRIWSTNWWIDPIAETKKLVSFIEANLVEEEAAVSVS